MSMLKNCVKFYLGLFFCWFLFFCGKLVSEINTSYQNYHVNLNLEIEQKGPLSSSFSSDSIKKIDIQSDVTCFNECLGINFIISHMGF